MAGFDNKYPYTDFHELNLDWILSQIEVLQSEVDDLIDKYGQYSKLLEEAEAYTDEEIVKVKALITANTTALNTLSKELTSQVNALYTYIAKQDDALRVDIDTKYTRTQQKFTEQWNNMVDYISMQVIDTKVRNFFTGKLVSLQSMFDYLALLHATDSGTYSQVSGNNTYQHYVNKSEIYSVVITTSRTFFNS